MIKIESHLGTTHIAQDYFAHLVGRAASECFGVSGLANATPYQGLRAILSKRELPDKGVRVRCANGGLFIDLHIVVTYGVNIAAIAKSIINKVTYTVEAASGMPVEKVNVFVDGMNPQ